MRACGRRLVLAGLICAAAPVLAVAAPILPGSTPCGGGLSDCALLPIDPYASPTVTGEFHALGDVALFSFTFAHESRLKVTTSSFAAGSFDPTLGLFHGDGLIVQYPDPAGSGAKISARFFDIDFSAGEYDDHLDLVLAPGAYLLALLAFENDFLGLPESLQAGFVCDSPLACDFAAFVPGSPFTFEVSATSTVPEPAMLSLLAAGAAMLARQRAKRLRRR